MVGVRSLIGSYDSRERERETSKMVTGEIVRYAWVSNQSIILMCRGGLQIETEKKRINAPCGIPQFILQCAYCTVHCIALQCIALH